MDNREKLIALRKETGMNRKIFAEYLGIPYRTMTDWELGKRSMTDYMIRLIEYRVRIDLLHEDSKTVAEKTAAES